MALAGLLIVAAPARAFYRWTPSATRISSGAEPQHPTTRSWGPWLAFVSTEGLTGSGGGHNQIFLFSVLDYACQKGRPDLRNPQETVPDCPKTARPYLLQVTNGAGEPDNPSVSSDGNLVAFDADGSFGGGNGPGVGHRQIFLKNRKTGKLIQITDSPDGDSVRPSLNDGGGYVVFESTASLLRPGQGDGVRQVFGYQVNAAQLVQLSFGAVDSSRPMTNKLGKKVVFQSRAALLGDGSDTGHMQIFSYDRDAASLVQITAGNGDSQNPWLEERDPGRVLFDSSATDLPGRIGGGRQVFAALLDALGGVSIDQLTFGPGNCAFPAMEPLGDRAVFICDGDLLSNGTTGNRLFAVELGTLSRTIYQITGRGDVRGPVGANIGQWFATVSTTDDMDGTGTCGHQLYVVDYYTQHYFEPTQQRQTAYIPGTIPAEPLVGDANAGCDDKDPCSADVCTDGSTCGHSQQSDGTQCGAGDVCTGYPVCQAGKCTPIAGIQCDDGDPCTRDVCNPAQQADPCVSTAIPATSGGLDCRSAQLGKITLGGGSAGGIRATTRMQKRVETYLARVDNVKPRAAAATLHKLRRLLDKFQHAVDGLGLPADLRQTISDFLDKTRAQVDQAMAEVKVNGKR